MHYRGQMLKKMQQSMESLGSSIKEIVKNVPLLDDVLDAVAREDVEKGLLGEEKEDDSPRKKIKRKVLLMPMFGPLLDSLFGKEKKELKDIKQSINKIQEKDPKYAKKYIENMRTMDRESLPKDGYIDDKKYVQYLHHLERKHKLPINTLVEVCKKESGGKLKGKDGEPLGSSAGAQGLFQFMPATAKDRYQKIDAPNPEAIAKNPIYAAEAAAAYLAEYGYKDGGDFDMQGALIAYNNGPAHRKKPLNTRPTETQDYYKVISEKVGYA